MKKYEDQKRIWRLVGNAIHDENSFNEFVEETRKYIDRYCSVDGRLQADSFINMARNEYVTGHYEQEEIKRREKEIKMTKGMRKRRRKC